MGGGGSPVVRELRAAPRRRTRWTRQRVSGCVCGLLLLCKRLASSPTPSDREHGSIIVPPSHLSVGVLSYPSAARSVWGVVLFLMRDARMSCLGCRVLSVVDFTTEPLRKVTEARDFTSARPKEAFRRPCLSGFSLIGVGSRRRFLDIASRDIHPERARAQVHTHTCERRPFDMQHANVIPICHEWILHALVSVLALVLVERLIQHFQSMKLSRSLNPEHMLPSKLPPATVELPTKVELPPLDAGEAARIAAGGLVFRPYRNDYGVNRGIAVQRVEAASSEVWAALLDFEAYPRMVDDVCASNVYEQNGCDVKVAVKVGYGAVGLTTCLHHTYDASAGQLTWTLDENRPSSFKSNEGFWVVRALDEGTNACVVYYSIAVELKGWVPSWVNDFVAEKGIPRAVGWLKREAERRQLQAAAKVQAAAKARATLVNRSKLASGGASRRSLDPAAGTAALHNLPPWLRGCVGAWLHPPAAQAA